MNSLKHAFGKTRDRETFLLNLHESCLPVRVTLEQIIVCGSQGQRPSDRNSLNWYNNLSGTGRYSLRNIYTTSQLLKESFRRAECITIIERAKARFAWMCDDGHPEGPVYKDGLAFGSIIATNLYSTLCRSPNLQRNPIHSWIGVMFGQDWRGGGPRKCHQEVAPAEKLAVDR